jgi:hypothetical protein
MHQVSFDLNGKIDSFHLVKIGIVFLDFFSSILIEFFFPSSEGRK